VGNGSTHHLITLLKYAFIGLVSGAVLVAVVAIMVSGPSSFFSKRSSWFGMEKDWAGGILLYLTVRGAILGLVLGVIGGVIRVLVNISRRG
jgi:hypothetical protein